MTTMVDAVYAQQVFQGFNDDAAPATATTIAGSNTNFNRELTAFQLRFRIAQTVATANQNNVKQFKLRVQVNGTGGYVDLGAQGSNTKIRFFNSTNFAQGDNIATGNFRLGTGTGTAVAGEADEGANTDSITFPIAGSASYTELVFAVQLGPTAVNGDTFEFRVYESANTALTTYTVTPTVTAANIPVHFTATPTTAALLITGQAPKLPGATSLAALNTNATLTAGTTYLLRVRVENTGSVGGTDFRWSYNHNSAGWNPVTTTSSAVKAVAAGGFANDADVEEVLTGSGTYIANNNAASTDGTTSLPAGFAASGAAEFLLSFQLVAADISNGQTGQIRLEEGDGTDFGTYSNTLTYTVTGAGASVTAQPGAGAVAIQGFAPTVSTAVAVEPTPGAVAIAGFAPVISTAAGVTAEPGVGSLTITRFAPTVAAGASVEPSPASRTITGFAPTITTAADVTVTPSTASVVVSGQLALFGIGEPWSDGTRFTDAYGWVPESGSVVTLTPGTGSLTVSGQSPVVSAGVTVTPDTRIFSSVGLAPTVTASAVVEPITGTVSITGYAPDVGAEGQYSGIPSTAALIITGFAPTVAASTLVEPGTANLTISSFAPTVVIPAGTVEIGAVEWLVAYELAQQDFTATPGTGAVTVTTFAPDVNTTGDVTLLPGVGSLALAGAPPTLAASSQVEPASGQIIITGHAPEVSAVSGVVVTPSTATLSITGYAPTVSAAATVAPLTATLSIAGKVPAVSAGTGATVAPATRALTITGYAPTVSAVSGVVVTPTTAAVTITGRAPSLQTSHQLIPAPRSIVVTGFAPTVIAGQDAVVTPQTGTLVVVGHAPTFQAHFTATPANVNLAITGRVPGLEGEQTAEPQTATVTIQGYPPFVIHLPAPGRRIYRVEAEDRQFAATGRRRVFRVGRRS